MYFDTHSHLNFLAFDKDREEVIENCLKEGMGMINVGTNYQTSKKTVKIAQKYKEGVLAAVGLHPIHLETGLVKIKNDLEEIEVRTKEEEFDYEKYKEIAGKPKVVAIGETGLDYYWRPKTTKKKEIFKQKQKDLLLKQLELAKELNLPVIFHCRMAHNDLIKELRITNYGLRIRGVMHGFVGTQEQLQEYLKMGFYIGFNGIIFKNIEGINFEENIRKTPLEKVLIETDCPYLLPPDYKKERNDPLGVKFVARRIAQIKKISPDKVAEQTFQNARELFGI